MLPFHLQPCGQYSESVDNLDEYIQMVKRTTGYDKVNLVNVSPAAPSSPDILINTAGAILTRWSMLLPPLTVATL